VTPSRQRRLSHRHVTTPRHAVCRYFYRPHETGARFDAVSLKTIALRWVIFPTLFAVQPSSKEAFTISRKLLYFFAIGIASLTSGCASVTGTPNQSISVQTREQAGVEVTGAACELTNNKGKWFVTTPGSVMIHRSNDDMQVLCNKTGYEPGRAAVVSETKGSMFGNIILGGGIGAIVDHNNGSAYEYPGFIQVLMGAFSKVESPKVPEQSAQGAAASPVATTPLTGLASNAPSLDSKLSELKRLYDSGLITQEVYLERQHKLLEDGNLQ